MYTERNSVGWSYLLYGAALMNAGIAWAILSSELRPQAQLIRYSAILPLLLLPLFVLLARVFSSYKVELSRDSLLFGYTHWYVEMPISAVKDVGQMKVGLFTFGGLGWRYGGGKIGYIAYLGEAVEISTEQRCYVFSCKDPKQFIAESKKLGIG